MKDPDHDSFSEEEESDHWELWALERVLVHRKPWFLEKHCEVCGTKPQQERGMTRDDAIERYGVWFAPFGLDGS